MAQVLPYLLYLACPVGMGVMMWMMRSNHPQQATPPAESRIAVLESQVSELRAALGAQEPEAQRD